jgi:hypothetical protein
MSKKAANLLQRRRSIPILLGAVLLVAAAAAMQAQNKAAKPKPLTALDYAEIEQLNAAYGHYIDTGEENGYAWANLFTPDGVFTRQAGDKYEGREKLAALGRNRGGPKFVSHFITNVMVQPSADGAIGRAYCVTMDFPDDKLDASDPRRSEVQLGCRYHDTYVRTSDGWRFKTRTIVVSAGHLPSTPRK